MGRRGVSPVRHSRAQWLLTFFAGAALGLGKVGFKVRICGIVGAFHGRADFHAGRPLDHIGPDVQAMAGVGRIAAAATSGAAAFLLVRLKLAAALLVRRRSSRTPATMAPSLGRSGLAKTTFMGPFLAVGGPPAGRAATKPDL